MGLFSRFFVEALRQAAAPRPGNQIVGASHAYCKSIQPKRIMR